MDLYLGTKYVHFLAIVGAIAGATLLHFNLSRLRRATTVGPARDAAGSIAKVAPLMPLFALALLVTGAVLVQQRWPWSSGWVIAAVVGLISMPLSAVAIVKPRMMAIGMSLKDAKEGPLDPSHVALINDRLIWGAMYYNHVMALTIMLIMVGKPSLVPSIAILLVPVLVGAWKGLAASSSAAGAAPPPRRSAPSIVGDTVSSAGPRRWVWVALLVGVIYLIIGRIPTWGPNLRFWRLAAWMASLIVFIAHLLFEHRRLRSSVRQMALHAATAVAVGAFSLALYGMIRSPSGAGVSLKWLLALVAWPAFTAIPAFFAALVAGLLLHRLAPLPRPADGAG